MRRKIVNFDKDDENHWRALLDCGHYQHVRHQPPLARREWVLTEEGRREKLGAELTCKKCDEESQIPDPETLAGYTVTDAAAHSE